MCHCVYISTRRGHSNIRHCLIYCSEVAVGGWEPLHLSPFLNGISTASTPRAVSHFNDYNNDSTSVCACMCVYLCGSTYGLFLQ